MKITVADQIDPVLIQSAGRDDCALELTRRCLPSPTAALSAACPTDPAPVLESAPIERAAGIRTQSAPGETCTDAPSQQHRTRLRGQQSRGNAAELALLARQIQQTHERYVSSVRTNLEGAMEVGGLLLQAKRQIGHGRFTIWMKSACDFLSLSTARAYMQLAKARPEVQARVQSKLQPAGVLTIKLPRMAAGRP